MKKKLFSAMTALTLTASLLLGCGGGKVNAPTPDDPKVLRIGVSTGDTDPRNISANEFAAAVSSATGGAIQATVTGGGILGSDSELIDSVALKSGKVDIVITDASNFASYGPKMGISALPFLFDNFDSAWAFMGSDIEAKAEDELEKHNIKVLAHYCNGFRCVTNSVHPIETPSDMKGLVIRTPENPIIMATMTALGANPQPLGFPELYAALRQGTYDAQENPVPVIYNNKLYEVQPYLSITNHIYSGMCFAISKSVWDSFTPEQKEIVEKAAKESAETDRELNRRQSEELLDQLRVEGMQVNEPELKPFAEATASVLESNRAIYGDLMEELEEWLETH